MNCYKINQNNDFDETWKDLSKLKNINLGKKCPDRKQWKCEEKACFRRKL